MERLHTHPSCKRKKNHVSLGNSMGVSSSESANRLNTVLPAVSHMLVSA